ncbi:Uu.00g134640.m01.CDS01 [Anthostomella pinea]|uniref:RNA-dependent RNA polymerase n=1 Tax=Anthostomella pinea TaxID=933095 RepID=A0AAI8VPM7_9PEZI|nr:Uu.00g134640.m01.CDS01 [Anthostomella pinea]
MRMTWGYLVDHDTIHSRQSSDATLPSFKFTSSRATALPMQEINHNKVRLNYNKIRTECNRFRTRIGLKRWNRVFVDYDEPSVSASWENFTPGGAVRHTDMVPFGLFFLEEGSLALYHTTMPHRWQQIDSQASLGIPDVVEYSFTATHLARYLKLAFFRACAFRSPLVPYYIVITGLCVIGRNPSLHPSDLRIVEAVDIPKLRYLRDVVVLPATGDSDFSSMYSGGDLDSDDTVYLVP